MMVIAMVMTCPIKIFDDSRFYLQSMLQNFLTSLKRLLGIFEAVPGAIKVDTIKALVLSEKAMPLSDKAMHLS